VATRCQVKSPTTLDIQTAARVIGVWPSTVRNMISRGELKTTRAGRIRPSDALQATPRGRGRPTADPEDLRGQEYADAVRSGKTPGQLAREYGVTRQAVSKALQLYRFRKAGF
jgi:hypothetical protein